MTELYCLNIFTACSRPVSNKMIKFTDCGDPTPANGSASMPTGTNYEDIAVISCDEGYVLEGDEYIVCLNGSKWSDYPTCIKGNPILFLNGCITLS